MALKTPPGYKIESYNKKRMYLGESARKTLSYSIRYLTTKCYFMCQLIRHVSFIVCKITLEALTLVRPELADLSSIYSCREILISRVPRGTDREIRTIHLKDAVRHKRQGQSSAFLTSILLSSFHLRPGSGSRPSLFPHHECYAPAQSVQAV